MICFSAAPRSSVNVCFQVQQRSLHPRRRSREGCDREGCSDREGCDQVNDARQRALASTTSYRRSSIGVPLSCVTPLAHPPWIFSVALSFCLTELLRSVNKRFARYLDSISR